MRGLDDSNSQFFTGTFPTDHAHWHLKLFNFTHTLKLVAFPNLSSHTDPASNAEKKRFACTMAQVPPLLWINGFPGSGKLTIAKKIVKLSAGDTVLIDNHQLIDPVAAKISRDPPRLPKATP